MSFQAVPPAGSPRWLALEATLAPHALRASESRGRRRPEAPHPYRSPFMRDRDRYRPEFPGLNLSFEVLDAVACRSKAAPCAAFADFRGAMQPSAECQLVDLSDSIAYDAHDIDDALRAGLLTLDDLAGLNLWR